MMPDSNFQDGDFEKALLLESHNLFKTLNCISGCEADLDKMRAHILKCSAALKLVQEANCVMKDSEKRAHNFVLVASIFATISGSSDALELAFPEAFEGGEDLEACCSPSLRWAIILEDNVRVEDVMELYLSDPIISLNHPSLTENSNGAETPLQLLCMQKHPDIQLINLLTKYDPNAYYSRSPYGTNALSIGFEYSESFFFFENLILQNILLKRETTEEATLLNILLNRSEFPALPMIIKYVLDAYSHSIGFIGGTISRILLSFNFFPKKDVSIEPESEGYKALQSIRLLLDANNDVAIWYRDRGSGCNLIHTTCRYVSGDLGIGVLSLLLGDSSTVLRTFCDGGFLPIHYAAQYNKLEILKFLLSADPETGSILTTYKSSLLHLAAQDREVCEDKVRFLCTRYPDMLHKRNSSSRTPIFYLFYNVTLMDDRVSFSKALTTICEVDATILTDLVSLNDYPCVIMLHHFVTYMVNESYTSKQADLFRLILKTCPLAVGKKDFFNRTPYSLGVDVGLDPYYKRLLLKADIGIDFVELCRLNYIERRQAMFLSFRAVSVGDVSTIWWRLREGSEDSLKLVISFL